MLKQYPVCVLWEPLSPLGADGSSVSDPIICFDSSVPFSLQQWFMDTQTGDWPLPMRCNTNFPDNAETDADAFLEGLESNERILHDQNDQKRAWLEMGLAWSKPSPVIRERERYWVLVTADSDDVWGQKISWLSLRWVNKFSFVCQPIRAGICHL